MSIQIATLPNGLRVATDSMAEAESVGIGVWVGVGTRHEPWAANGVAHLVEHMMFKGTKRRSAYEISAAIEQNGGSMNAHTSREETAYYARVLPEDAALALDIISDMLQHSRFDPTELDRERQVIIQEIGRDLDTPEDHVFDLVHAAAFPKQKIGRSILGTTKVIAHLPRAAVVDYVGRHYHAANMVVVAAGKVKHEEIVKLATKHFAKLPRGKVTVSEVAKLKSGEIRNQQANEQLHLIMALAGPSRTARSVYAASLLAIILGGSSASRLFQKVREERGLVYAISASHMAFQDAGLFHIYAGTDPARVRELMPVVCRELRGMANRITPQELQRAKAQVRAELLMGQESIMRRAEALGHQMLCYGKPIPLAQTLAKYMAAEIPDLKAVAGKMLSRPPIITALGQLDGLESYDKITARLAG